MARYVIPHWGAPLWLRAVAEAFGERLHRLRTERLMSQRALAERVGIEHRMIGRFERGDNKPRIDTAVGLARVLNVTTDYLLSGRDPDAALRTAILRGTSREILLAMAKREM